jgi:hypothetical protein
MVAPVIGYRHPFTLSLSKGFDAAGKAKGFDELSPNGRRAAPRNARRYSCSTSVWYSTSSASSRSF